MELRLAWIVVLRYLIGNCVAVEELFYLVGSAAALMAAAVAVEVVAEVAAAVALIVGGESQTLKLGFEA